MDRTAADRAERLARRRSVVAIALGSILIATQGLRMDRGGGGPVAWAIAGLITLLFLLWASGLFRSGALRGILNDEGSEASRRRALAIAFWNMMATALVCYALSYVKAYGPRDAIQIILTVGISSALIALGVSESVASRP